MASALVLESDGGAMQNLDSFTLYLVIVACCLALNLVWLVVARCFPTMDAAKYWFAATLAATVGSIASLFKGYLDPLALILLSSGSVLLATGLGWGGVCRFQGKPTPWATIIVVTAAALAGLTAFALWRDSVAMRIVIFAVAQSILVGMAAFDLLAPSDDARMPGAIMAGTACIVLMLVNTTRATLAVFDFGEALSFVGWNPLQTSMVFLLAVFGALVWQFGFLLMTMDRLRSEMAQLAGVDDLTGVANRRRLLEWSEQECIRSCRSGRPFALMVMDIDQFKSINDSCGHAAGDEVLKLLTRTTLRLLRAQDKIARLGGDEFCLLLPETSGAQAKAVAQRLVSEFRDKTAFYEGRTIMATISVGVAEWSSEIARNSLGLIALADRALYQTKQRGRDGVTLEGSMVSAPEPGVMAA